MKLRYFLPLFVAIVAMFTGCATDQDRAYLGEIRLSQSYVALNTAGGSTQVTITASLTFSAQAAEGRTATVKINCGNKTQEVNIIQGIAKVSTATCAQVIAGPDSKTYRVTGTVTGIANTVYGNWYMNDGTGELYIYGTLDKNGRDGRYCRAGERGCGEDQ